MNRDLQHGEVLLSVKISGDEWLKCCTPHRDAHDSQDNIHKDKYFVSFEHFVVSMILLSRAKPQSRREHLSFYSQPPMN